MSRRPALEHAEDIDHFISVQAMKSRRSTAG
jgi:hypothetical protein